jgi:NADPH:quinone reductase-like Zn-dependent oxidoreductase
VTGAAPVSPDGETTPTIPTTMRAVLLLGHGGLDKLAYRDEVAVPRPAPDEVLIRVMACGVNNTDINTRIGWYNPGVREGTHAEAGTRGLHVSAAGAWGASSIAFPRIQGADVVGRIVAVGERVPASRIGERVLVDPWLRDPDRPADLRRARYYGSETDGGFGEYATAAARNVHAVCSDLSDAELATFACSYSTAENMLTKTQVGGADTVLVPGASGGVGSALVQLAKRRGAKVVALCGEAKAGAIRELGVDAVLPRAPTDLAKVLREVTGRAEVDVVADVVGGPLFGQLIDVLRPGGRYTCAGAIAGPIVELDLRPLYLKDLVFTGATVTAPEIFADLVGYIERREIRPLLAETYPLAEIRRAQTDFLHKGFVGKLVMVI